MLVADAAVVVAALTDQGGGGEWARSTLEGQHLASVALMPFEAANALRGLMQGRVIDAAAAALAVRDLRRLAVDLFPFEVVAGRAWALRDNLTIYDAAYVALAEWAAVDLVTLDRRIERAPGIRCGIRTRPD